MTQKASEFSSLQQEPVTSSQEMIPDSIDTRSRTEKEAVSPALSRRELFKQIGSRENLKKMARFFLASSEELIAATRPEVSVNEAGKMLRRTPKRPPTDQSGQKESRNSD